MNHVSVALLDVLNQPLIGEMTEGAIDRVRLGKKAGQLIHDPLATHPKKHLAVNDGCFRPCVRLIECAYQRSMIGV